MNLIHVALYRKAQPLELNCLHLSKKRKRKSGFSQGVNPTDRKSELARVMSVNRNASADGTSTGKREDYISWADYFMGIAFLSAQRSKDPKTQVGACIVNDLKRIVGTGYNGFPDGCSGNDERYSWVRDKDPLKSKHTYVCHAEMNAVLNKNSADVRGCTMYVSLFPCNECAKIIIQAGIKKVVYYSNKYGDRKEFQASKNMLEDAKVEVEEFDRERNRKEIKIVFSEIDEASDKRVCGPSS